MGSFHVSCGVSSIPIIEGQNTGVQLFVKKEAPDYRDDDVMIMRPTRYYKLLCSPIYGEYDGSGNLVSIEESTASKVLEDTFHMPIEMLIEALSENRDVYSSISVLHKHFMKKDNLLDTFGAPTREILLSLGFESDAVEDVTYHGREAEVFRYKSSHILVADDKIREVYLDGLPVKNIEIFAGKDISEQLAEYADVTGIYPGVAEEHFKPLSILKNIGMMYFLPSVVKDFNQHVLSDSWQNAGAEKVQVEVAEYVQQRELLHKTRRAIAEKELSDEVRKELESVAEKMYTDNRLRFSKIFQNIFTFENTYRVVNAQLDEKDLVSVLDLYRVMQCANKVFMPSIYVPEEESFESALALSKITQSIIEERKREWEEY